MKTELNGLFAVLIIALLTGCGQSSTVTGNVTSDGNAVDGGKIVFRPVAGDTKPAIGRVNGDGTYELKTSGGKGLTPGDYTIVYVPPIVEEDDDGNPLGDAKWYNKKAPDETIEVEPGANDIPIELQEKQNKRS